MKFDHIVRPLFVIGLLLVPPVLFAQKPEEDAAAADEPIQASGRFFQLSLKNRPSLRIGKFANVDVKAKWQLDYRRFQPRAVNLPGVVTAFPVIPDNFFLRRARFGVKGSVTKYVDYEFERDLRSTVDRSINEYHPWKDNYVNVSLHKLLRVRVGKFKMPFGMEETGSEDKLDYAFKSPTSDTLAPSRERGVMLYGTFIKGDRMTYQAGVFRHDGENSGIHGIPTGERTYAARLTGEPLRAAKFLPKTIRHVYLGAAATMGRMVEGLNSINGQTFSGFTYMDRFFVRGNRMRLGAEMSWTEGPVGIKSEYIHVSEERTQQGIRGENLPDKISRGWYVAASWTALGKMKAKGSAPKNPFLTGHGFGAVELSARFDMLAFFSAAGSGIPARSPRASTILPNGERTWTLGPTWYLNRFVKIQANVQREMVTDIERKAVFGRNRFWTGIIRLQGAM